jgi:hypothetical protein
MRRALVAGHVCVDLTPRLAAVPRSCQRQPKTDQLTASEN